MLALSKTAACAEYLSALPGFDRTKVRMIYEISCMVWLCKYEMVSLF
jgi:hypothetical protein